MNTDEFRRLYKCADCLIDLSSNQFELHVVLMLRNIINDVINQFAIGFPIFTF